MGGANALSEENLRIYNAACPKSDGYFQVNLIWEEKARAAERESYRKLFGEADDLLDGDFSPQDTDMEARRNASLETLKLYSGSFASLSTPMSRFVALSPTQDPHPWLEKTAMNDTGIASGDLEALDVRRLASEMVSAEAEPAEADRVSVGSPRPSSDTLSVARFHETFMESVKEKKEQHRSARNWRRLKMRRRKTLERTKAS